MNSQKIIRKLKLKPHPEGGFYRETYRAKKRLSDGKAASTAIYFLLRSRDVSHLHRIESDELWHFYAGSDLEIICLQKNRAALKIKLGPNGPFQAVVPAGVWFGARVLKKNSYALVGCTVAPGFEFRDFEMGERARLLKQFPRAANEIRSLTK